ncbi:MAG: hypothetical protein JW715_17195 [Sedimentisphaerales bacterium]|nr:hypothetical protein [Sedimentisphaerales bacterium]
MMKSVSTSVCKVFLAILLSILVFLPCGCTTAQLGETQAQGHRRHIRNLRINQRQMMEDIDMVFMTDQPSRLTDRRIP